MWIITVVCVLSLTGCGNNEVDYVTESNTPTDGIATNISTGTLEEQIGAEDVWEEDIDIAKGKKICAEVVIPDVSGMKVVNLERVSFDAEFKESFMNCLTDGPVYKYDYEYLPKADIQENIEYYKTVLAKLEAEGVDPYREESEYYNLYQCLLDEEKMLESAPDEYISVDDYSNDVFLCNYNNSEYIVSFLEEDNSTDRKITFKLKEPASIFEEDYSTVEFGYRIDYGNTEGEDTVNQCEITDEEARTIAIDFVEKFGLGEYAVVNTDDMTVYCDFTSGVSETFNYGYEYTLYRCIDNIVVDGNSYINSSDIMMQYLDTLTDYGAFDKSYSFEEIHIYVTDEGVVQMEYISPFYYKEIVAENVNLMSFDNIKNIIVTQIDESTYYDYETFEYMELGYYNYWSDDYENAVVIPVWKLITHTMGDDLSINSAILINAMDGSVIDIGKQQYQNYSFSDE